MARVKFEDVATRVNTREDRLNTTLLYYVGGEHIESNEFLVQGRGLIKGSTIGPMFYCGFKKGDVLLVSRNPHLRKASMVEFDGICSEKTFVLGTKDQSKLLQEFLAIICQSDDFWNYCEEHKSGGVNYFLNWSTLAKYEFDLPSLSEQKILADKLWAAYRLKESYKKLLAATDEMVKSQFIEMFGTTENNHKGFPVIAMRDIIESINYGTSKPATEGGSVPYLRMNNITYDGYLDLSEIKHINLSIEEDEKSFVQKGDLMFNRTNTKEFVGKTCVYDQDTPMVIAGYIIRVRFKAGYYSEYVSGYLNSQYGKKRLREMAKGAVHQANINAQEFQSIPILNVSEELQKQYIRIFQQADKSKFELRKSIEAIDAVIKSLINN